MNNYKVSWYILTNCFPNTLSQLVVPLALRIELKYFYFLSIQAKISFNLCFLNYKLIYLLEICIFLFCELSLHVLWSFVNLNVFFLICILSLYIKYVNLFFLPCFLTNIDIQSFTISLKLNIFFFWKLDFLIKHFSFNVCDAVLSYFLFLSSFCYII